MKSLLLLSRLFLACSLSACGSTHTVDSQDVPLRTPSEDEGASNTAPNGNPQDPRTRPSSGVQDIHQSYTLTSTNEGNDLRATAQFRVRHGRGDTIRFASPRQVQFQGIPLSKIDGADVNTAITLLNHLTVIPLFSLFRTGTFYADSFPGVAAGTFRFEDDFGNATTTLLRTPKLEPVIVPAAFAFAAATGTLVVKVVSVEEYAGVDLHCTLASKHTVAEGGNTTRVSTGTARIESRPGSCEFSRTDLLSHAGAIEPIAFKLEFLVKNLTTDAFGRAIETRTSHVHTATLRALPTHDAP
ncbi:MAG: hypothetical protein IOD12_17805 [Silvanigrellales bacterium]|nr:hypothetical protein [Silvanigrellales bacterium]